MTGATQLNSSLLTLSVIAVLLPAAFHSAVQPSSGQPDPLTNAQEGHDILAISHGVNGFLFCLVITADNYSSRLRLFYFSVSLLDHVNGLLVFMISSLFLLSCLPAILAQESLRG
jgi:hypothetical protein